MDFEAIRRKRRLYFYAMTRGGRSVDPNLAFTKALMGMEGSDASTTFVDEGPLARSGIVATGNAQIDTAQFKFGASSALFDGTGDGVSLDISSDWHFGSGDFTVEAQLRPSSVSGVRWIIGQGDSLSDDPRNGWAIWAFNGVPRFSYVAEGSSTWVDAVVGVATLPTSSWSQLMVAREGNTIRLFVEGALDNSAALTATFKNASATDVRIGTTSTSTYGYAGHIDEPRILKGKAAQTAAFTAPTAAYERP